jgi:hypothetical protein
MKNVRTTIIAAVISAIVVYGVIRVAPALTNYATAVSVVTVIIVAWYARKRTDASAATGAPSSIGH